MNREVKFRAWDGEKMIDWLTLSQSAWNRDMSILYRVMVSHRPDYDLMQYTGLKDKNGKEIYEGDIVNGASFNGSYAHGEVVWWTGGWCIQPIPDIEGIVELYINVSTYEVIGNVYENKELIQKIKGE